MTTLSWKKFKTLKAMGVTPGERSTFGTGFNPWHPYEYARLVLLLLARWFPKLRSDIMVIGQKGAARLAWLSLLPPKKDQTGRTVSPVDKSL